MIIIAILAVLLLIFISIEISGIVTNTHSTNRYLNDIKNQLDEILEHARDRRKDV